MTIEPVLSLRGLTKRFGSVLAAEGIDLDLGRGEVLALLGENGAGKTTLMNMLFGQYVPDAGEVLVFDEGGGEKVLPPGQPQAAIDARIGMVHQHFTLAENLSVLDSVLLGTEPLFRLVRRRGAAREKLRALMERSGLKVPLEARIGDLSVGERQRVEILKALYRDVRILVLDEPVQGVDFNGEVAMYELIGEIRDRAGCGVLLISHDLHVVMAATDTVICLNGHVCCSGSPENVAASEEYRSLFGARAAEAVAFYRHQHDHTHLPDGRVKHADGSITEHCHPDDGHHDHDAHRHRGEDPASGEQHPRHRQHHRGTGHQDGAPDGGHRGHECRVGAAPGGADLAVAPEHEQRVVDTERQAQHGDGRCGRVAHGNQR